MPRIICTLPNASTEINGHKFEPVEGGVVSGELSQEVVDTFLEISGYALFEEDPAAVAEAAAKEAKAAAAKAEKLAATAKAATANKPGKKSAAAPAPVAAPEVPAAAPAPEANAETTDAPAGAPGAELDESVF